MAAISLGHLLFIGDSIDGRRAENICFMSRNLFSDDGPILFKEETTVTMENEDILAEREEDKEEERVVLWQQAEKKYELFRAMNEELLDPNLEMEFEIMRQMGLPTMLVNNYDDMEEENEEEEESNHYVRIHKKKPRHTKITVTEEITDGITDENTDGITVGNTDGITDGIIVGNTEGVTVGNMAGLIEDSNPLLMDYRIDDDDDSSDCSSHPSSPFPAATALDEFEVDWDEVREGKAAGLPSQWIVVESHEQEEEEKENSTLVEQQPLEASVSDELYAALSVKAQAYADKQWLEYWELHGPSYLAECWKVQYPSIALKHVEIVSGVCGLCESLERQMQLDTTATVSTDEREERGQDASILTDREILSLWNEFYNTTYWYTYSLFQLGKEEEATTTTTIEVEKEQEQEQVTTKEKEDYTCTAATVAISSQEEEEREDTQSILPTTVNNKSCPVQHTQRTIHFIKGLGFTIGDNVGINPHKRTFSRVICKLLQQKEDSMIVNNEGQLVMKRQKKLHKKKKPKKKKSKRSFMVTPTIDTPTPPVTDNIIDNSTGQTEAHAIQTDSNAIQTDSNVIQTDSNTTHTQTNSYTTQADSSTTQTESNTTQTESYTTQTNSITATQTDAHVFANSTAESESDVDKTESEGEGDGCLDIKVIDQTDSLAGGCIIYSEYLPLRDDISNDHKLSKYWSQRYRLFSLYDKDIRMDDEGWFSASPEKIASHIAERCQCDLIVDAFCGVGSNAIQFAFTCERVIAIDIDPVKIACARHNAQIYGVADRIEFILGDYFDVMPYLTCADVVFISPPWGGPQYLSAGVYDLKTMVALNGVRVFEVANAVTSHIAYYLPRNIGIDQLVSMVPTGRPVEVEQQFMNRKLKTITAYFGELVNPY